MHQVSLPDWLSDWSLQTDGSICGYWREGQKNAPIVHLLHGNGFCGLSLFSLADELPKNWNILITDMPGHGLSLSGVSEFPVWSDIADKLARFVTKVIGSNGRSSIQPVVGIGHSMGGVMTAMMAHRHPALFDRLILLDPVLFPSNLIRLQRFLKWSRMWPLNPLVRQARRRRTRWPDRIQAAAYFRTRRLYARWDQRSLDGYVEFGLKPGGDGVELACAAEWEARIFASAPDGMWQSVKGLQMPVQILLAEGEFFFIEAGVNRAVKINPVISAEHFGGSHCFPMEAPVKVADRIVSLVN